MGTVTSFTVDPVTFIIALLTAYVKNRKPSERNQSSWLFYSSNPRNLFCPY